MDTEQLAIKVHRIFKFEHDKPLKAFVDITLNESILIKGVKVIDGQDGLFVTMPREMGKDNKWYDRVRCLNNDVRQQISEEVLRAYDNHEL